MLSVALSSRDQVKTYCECYVGALGTDCVPTTTDYNLEDCGISDFFGVVPLFENNNALSENILAMKRTAKEEVLLGPV